MSYEYEKLIHKVGHSVTLIDGQARKVSLTITKVDRSKMTSSKWDSFSVFFSGQENFHVPQGTYRLSDSELGEEDFFLSPKSVNEYELVINRQKIVQPS